MTEPSAEQRVSTLELFFDLVFVFTITQLTAVLRDDTTVLQAAQVLVLLAIIFWMYGGYVWLTNAVSADRTSRRLVLLAGMAAFFILALTIPDAFNGGGLAFAVAYAVVVAVHIGLFSRATRVRSLAGVFRLARFNAAIAVGVVIGGLVGDSIDWRWQIVIWGAVALFAWVVVPRAEPGSFDIGAAHFVERHGLVVIIAIGESVVALGLGLDNVEFGMRLIAVALLGLALSACLWWTYFGRDDDLAVHALLSADPSRRSMLAIEAYGYAHLAILFGIISIAAAVEEVAHHPGEVLDAGLAFALGCGGALFLLGLALFRWTLAIGPVMLRLLAAVACIATVLVGVSASAAAQLAVLLLIFLTLIAGEWFATAAQRQVKH